MKTIFVDAYYFIAALNPRDSGHARAASISPKQWQRLVTTEWVLIEAANALSTPILRAKFIELVDNCVCDRMLRLSIQAKFCWMKDSHYIDDGRINIGHSLTV